MRTHEQILELVHRATNGDPNALEAIVVEIQDDLYNLARRMVGYEEAEDVCQEILIQVVTHLAQWRAEASFRTWTWRIATRHLLRVKQSRREELCSFDELEGAIALGSGNPPLPGVPEAELRIIEEELKLNCTEAMMLSLDRDHRLAWVLGEIFELDSVQAGEVLEIEPGTYRKRLSRARERLGVWMNANCGVVDPKNPCNCRRQIPVALEHGFIHPEKLEFVGKPVVAEPRKKRLAMIHDQLAVAAQTLSSHPEYAAPARMVEKLRELVRAGRL